LINSSRTLMGAAAFAAMAFVAACGSEPQVPQDPIAAAPANYSLVLENSAVRVLKINYAPGDKGALHNHPDAMVVALSGGKMRFAMADGTTVDSELATEAALYSPAQAHSPSNVGTTRFEAILVEFKRDAPGTATLPPSREAMGMTQLAEGPYAVAHRVTADPAFEEPAGSTHEYDQVAIALSSGSMSVALGDEAPRTSWARGDVLFIGRGVPHATKNLAGAPVDFIIVSIK
jgi:quercetin dioxygenase-like cupin family protein